MKYVAEQATPSSCWEAGMLSLWDSPGERYKGTSIGLWEPKLTGRGFEAWVEKTVPSEFAVHSSRTGTAARLTPLPLPPFVFQFCLRSSNPHKVRRIGSELESMPKKVTSSTG
jgi:hypothetical protein